MEAGSGLAPKFSSNGSFTMDKKEFIPDILKRLSDADDPNDIIFDLCEKSGLSWPEAEALVRGIQEEHGDDIAVHQSPLLTAIAFATFVCGLAVLAYGIYPIVLAVITLIQQGNFQSLLRSQEFSFFVNFMVRTGINPFIAIFFGAAMILGSLLGMQDVWVSLLSRLKIGR